MWQGKLVPFALDGADMAGMVGGWFDLLAQAQDQLKPTIQPHCPALIQSIT
jgi:hypothetical protein